MILHTVINPYEVMLQNNSNFPAYEYINRDGCILQCIKQPDGDYLDGLSVQILEDYLNNQYKIGEIFTEIAVALSAVYIKQMKQQRQHT